MMILRHAACWGLLGLVFVGACGGGDAQGRGDARAIFGDGKLDNSRVVATVDGEKITERMLDFRVEELTGDDKVRFAGEDGRRLLVRRMVEELLRVREAERNKLDEDPEVARVLNYQYRTAMDLAQNAMIVRGREPTLDQIRDFYERNREQYVRLGTMHASHIECRNRADAQAAYDALRNNKMSFDKAVREFSKNTETFLRGGDLGWFNKGGFIGGIKNSSAFSEAIWDLDMGLNPPLEVDGSWHVVKVHKRDPERLMTLDEGYDRIRTDCLSEFRADLQREWLNEMKPRVDIEYFGEFRPGQGRTAKELLDRALHHKDPHRQADLFKMVIEEYPDDEYADDAMFFAANHHLDRWGDTRMASFYLRLLLRKFPDSELAADAQFLLDNVNKRKVIRPQSIDDLKQDR